MFEFVFAPAFIRWVPLLRRTLVVLALIFALLFVAHAYAQDAAAPAVSPNAILLGPLVTWLGPAVGLLLQGLVGLAVTILSAKAYQWFHVQSDATQVAQWKSAASTEAGALWAKETDQLKTAVLTVNDPRIAAAANNVIQRVPALSAAIGVTPEAAATIVLGEIGKLKAAATPAVAAPADAPKA
jgi:hypothetical protein